MRWVAKFCRFEGRWLLCLALLVLGTPVWAAPRVQASLDRAEIAPGEAATLTITIANEDARPLLPQLSGLHILLTGQRVSSQYFGGGNGQTTFTRTYQVSADHEGDFTIAPISVDGQQLPPLHLKVSGSAVQGGQPQPGTSGAAAAADEKHALPFMRVVLPRDRLYVGEEVPIQIKAYFREGTEAHMSGALAVTGDAFTATGLDDHPARSEETVEGQPWVVLTWSSVLGAIKSGSYPLNIELPLIVRLRLGGDSDMEQRLQALFGMAHTNGFIGDNLDEIFGKVVERHLVLKPQATQVQVLPLPEAGKPADFSGAVGHFNVNATLSPQAGAVGEPLTLAITVSGQGNLARINTPGLAESAQWRTYRPEVRQTAVAGAATAGSKIFSQPIVPKMPGTFKVPGIALSWFDPDTERYETRTTPDITVRINPARGEPSDSLEPPAATSQPAAASAPAVVESGHARSLQPVIRKPWFLALLLAPVVALLLALSVRAVGGYVIRTRHSERAVVHSVRRWLALMDEAITRNDPIGFFEVARRALQQHPPALPAAAQVLFDAADQVAYGGGSMPAEQLRKWRERVAALLQGGQA